jgi:hypothetical protein
MPRLTGQLHPRKTWLSWASNFLITHPILRIWPHRTTTCSVDWKSNLNFANFLPTQRSLLLWRPGWTDRLLIIFEWLAKGKATVKNIELHGECVGWIPKLFTVACFFLGRAKDLSVPPCMQGFCSSMLLPCSSLYSKKKRRQSLKILYWKEKLKVFL